MGVKYIKYKFKLTLLLLLLKMVTLNYTAQKMSTTNFSLNTLQTFTEWWNLLAAISHKM